MILLLLLWIMIWAASVYAYKYFTKSNFISSNIVCSLLRLVGYVFTQKIIIRSTVAFICLVLSFFHFFFKSGWDFLSRPEAKSSPSFPPIQFTQKGKVKMGRFMSSAYFLILFNLKDKKKERWLLYYDWNKFWCWGERDLV